MVSHALTAAGHRTGRYTSPHLVALEERFAVDGTSGLPRIGSTPPSPASAMRSTRLTERGDADRRADVLRGDHGRRLRDLSQLDAWTSRSSRSDLGAGSTPRMSSRPRSRRSRRSMSDHEAQLGTTIAAIAAREGRHHQSRRSCGRRRICTTTRSRSIAAVASARSAPLTSLSERATIDDRRRGSRPIRVDGAHGSRCPNPAAQYGPVLLGLRGRHQVGNAVVATLILDRLRGGTVMRSIARPIEAGLRDARWPGRLDLVAIDGRSVLVDGAHNPAGAKALASYLSEVHPGAPADRVRRHGRQARARDAGRAGAGRRGR